MTNERIDKELEISIDLGNFEYSGTKHDENQKNNKTNFFGRTREKTRLLNRLTQGKGRGGSFLVAGYRGVGKTRFVTEVLRNYRNEKIFKRKFIEVRVNLGNDGDLSSKSVLFNMIYLLNNALRKEFGVHIFRAFFGNILHSFLSITILLGALLGILHSHDQSYVPILSSKIALFLNSYPGLSIVL